MRVRHFVCFLFFNLRIFVSSCDLVSGQAHIRSPNGHQQLLQPTFPAPASTPRPNTPRFHTRTPLNPRFTPGIPTLCIFSTSSSSSSTLFAPQSLPSVYPPPFTSRAYTEPTSSPQHCARLLCLGNRWCNRSIWHATWSKCCCRRAELFSAQRMSLLILLFLLIPYLLFF